MLPPRAALLAAVLLASNAAWPQAPGSWHGPSPQAAESELDKAKRLMDQAYRLMNSRRVAEAVAPEREAIALFEKVYAADPSMRAYYLRTASVIELYAGNADEALKQLARARASCPKKGADCVAAVDMDVAHVRSKQGRHADSIKLLEGVLKSYESRLGKDSGYLKQPLLMLADSLRQLGRDEEAAAAQKRAAALPPPR